MRHEAEDTVNAIIPDVATGGSPVGSHQFIDEFNLAYHCAVAQILRREPEAVITRARQNIARWIQSDVYDEGERPSLFEWDKILVESSVEELIAIITEDSDEGQRLRQSTPFTGILPKQQRTAILADCEKRASA
jgi:hypothetical protein